MQGFNSSRIDEVSSSLNALGDQLIKKWTQAGFEAYHYELVAIKTFDKIHDLKLSNIA